MPTPTPTQLFQTNNTSDIATMMVQEDVLTTQVPQLYQANDSSGIATMIVQEEVLTTQVPQLNDGITQRISLSGTPYPSSHVKSVKIKT